MKRRKLLLEDGSSWTGTAFGSMEEQYGELIFFTGMTGYQEVLTDPTYAGKMVVMTYPHIGAYGVNRDDFESISPAISGLIVRELCETPSNFRSEASLDTYVKAHGIPGISGLDTRMLTNRLREKGSIQAAIVAEDIPFKELDFSKRKLDHEQLKEVSISKPYIVPGRGKRIVLVDLGMKQSILEELSARGCHITVVPYTCTKEEIQRFKPDGILLSNGPGNPEALTETIQTIQGCKGTYPIFGIGLGHQLLAHAYGATTKKLVIGQYGVHFPVKDMTLEKTYLTTQSKSYEVEESSLQGTGLQVTHRGLNDQAVEGLTHPKDMAFSVQFHPEGAPGSNETNYLFDDFLKKIAAHQRENGGYQHA